MKNNIKEIYLFGFAYSCVIIFCLFGPIMQVVMGTDVFKYSIISLVAFLIAFLNPFFDFFSKKRVIILYIITSLIILYIENLSFLKEFFVFLFSFEIAIICRGFTLHVFDDVDKEKSNIVMAFAFFVAFSILYFINISIPILSPNIAKLILVFLGYISVYFYSVTIEEKVIKRYDNKFNIKKLLPLLSLYLVYIGGGVSYAGIYPFLNKFYYIDRYYNVFPLVIFMPVAGYIGKKYGNIANLFIGILSLSLSFSCFMFEHTIVTYFLIQTFLQIGWAFTNVFGFSFSWNLSFKYKNPLLFGYGIIFILLGVTTGSIISNFILVKGLPIAFFGVFSFVPLIISLIFLFLYNGLSNTIIDNEKPDNYIWNTYILDEEGFFSLDILNDLTKREKEIIYHYYNSDTAVKIADKLNVSPNTVRTHIKNSYGKLNVTKREELQDLINNFLKSY